MTDKERLQRICQLLAKACMLAEAKAESGRISVLSGSKPKGKDGQLTREPTDEERIVI